MPPQACGQIRIPAFLSPLQKVPQKNHRILGHEGASRRVCFIQFLPFADEGTKNPEQGMCPGHQETQLVSCSVCVLYLDLGPRKEETGAG